MKVVLEEASYQRCGRVEFLLLLLKSQRMTRKTKPKTETMKRPVQSRSPRVPAGERERERGDEISTSSPASNCPPPSPSPSLSLFSLSKIFTRLQNNGAALPSLFFAFLFGRLSKNNLKNRSLQQLSRRLSTGVPMSDHFCQLETRILNPRTINHSQPKHCFA